MSTVHLTIIAQIVCEFSLYQVSVAGNRQYGHVIVI